MVVVPDEIARSDPKRRRFAELLGYPHVGRVPCHAEVHDTASAQLDDDEDEDRTKAQVDRALGHLDTQLEQLTADPLGTPEAVF